MSSSIAQRPCTDFATAVFEAVDAQDAARFASYFAPDGRITFGNAEPVVGRDDVRASTEQFFTTIAALRHHIVHEWGNGPDRTIELLVTYTRLDGEQVTVPAAVIWTVDADGLFADYRIFFDLAPVYA